MLGLEIHSVEHCFEAQPSVWRRESGEYRVSIPLDSVNLSERSLLAFPGMVINIQVLRDFTLEPSSPSCVRMVLIPISQIQDSVVWRGLCQPALAEQGFELVSNLQKFGVSEVE